MSGQLTTEILITGAGPAGTTAALFLAGQGIACTLVDKAAFPRDKICGDALSGKTVEVIKQLDPAWLDELRGADQALGSWGVTFVAPNGESLRVPFAASTALRTAPGYISKRIDFDNWLFQKAKAHPLVHVLEKTELRHFEKNANGISATSNDGLTIKANMVIAADGAYSSFAKQMAGLITEPVHNCFGLRAYYSNVSGLDAENYIELHFIKAILPGYFWIFPLPNGQANVGIGMRADKLAQRKLNLKKLLEQVIRESPGISERFANARLIDDIRLYGLPLGSKKRPLSGDHYLLCGDAAQLIDPFTGEGIGNAMMSGMYAARQAARCVQTGNYSAAFMHQYDDTLYARLWSELLLSYRMQQLVNFPSLFNVVVRKANTNPVLRETISCMFENIDLRARLKSPAFYLKLLFS